MLLEQSSHHVTWHSRLLVGLMLALLLGWGCSDDEERGNRALPKPSSGPKSSYSIKIRAGSESKRVDLPPVQESQLRVPLKDLLSSRKLPTLPDKFMKGIPKTASASDQVHGTAGPGPKPQTLVDTPDGGTIVEGDLSSAAGWALVYGAAYECGMGARRDVARPHIAYPYAQTPVIPPWSASGSYFVFQVAPVACDPQTAYEETLLCIADKLFEVAETPAPLRWSKVPASPSVLGLPAGPWEIPPQAASDRFIARDLGMHVLAMLGFTDLIAHPAPPNASNPQRTCAQAYGEAAALQNATPAPGELQNYFDTVFFVSSGAVSPYLPPLDVPVVQANFWQLARARFLFASHVLRAAGRMLHDQVSAAVYADLAGGERQRARATDPIRGARLLWGAESDANEPYNSLAHSTRVIGGRWERGSLEALPWLPCGSVTPTDLLAKGMAAEFSARHSDRPIATEGQRLATRLVAQSGVVLPTTAMADTTAVRGALRAQLVANAASFHQISPSDPDFSDWGEGRAITDALETLSDEDLAFGLQKNLLAYRQLTSKSDTQALTLSATDPGGGLAAGSTSPSVASLGGIAIDGGMPQRDLASDVSARISGVQSASQCNEFGDLGGALLADLGYLAAFQDAFHIGETFKKRLIALREEATREFGAEDEAAVVPNGGAVEIRTWTGPGRMVLTSDGTLESGPATLHLFLIGFNPEDFAVKSARDIPSEVVLAHGLPWVGECAARTRTSCPSGFDTDYLVPPSSWTLWSALDPASVGFDRTWSRLVGSDGVILQLDFNVSAAHNKFLPKYINNTTPAEQLFVVARHDPIAPTERGRVLGSPATRTPGGATSAQVSVAQKKLWNKNLGVSPKYLADGPFAHGPATSDPPAYCIEGVDRQPFVPLENELTSDSDEYESSWRHYLALAKEAAKRADELGNELIELGLKRDLRREAAQEKLADICGDYGALDEVPFDKSKGTVGKSSTDKALNSCLSEEKRHIVFLTTEPPDLAKLPKTDKVARTQWLREHVLRCNAGAPANENPLCDTAQYPELSSEALSITPYQALPKPDPSQCDSAAGVVQSLVGGGLNSQKLQILAGSPWFTQPSLLAALSQLRIYVQQDGDWYANYGASRIMSTLPADARLWPRCLAATNPLDQCSHSNQVPGVTDPEPISLLLDRVFRADSWPPYLGNSAASKIGTLWRVQGAAWTLGALAGRVPAGTVHGFVPAAKVATLPNPAQGWPANEPVPLLTLYGHSTYTSPSGTFWNLSIPSSTALQLTDADIAFIGSVEDVQPGFDFTFTNAPQWVQGVYNAPGGRYLHVQAQNAAYESAAKLKAYDGTKQAPYLPTDKGPNIIDQEKVGVWLSSRAQNFAGMKCAGFDTAPVNGNANQQVGWKWVSFAKFAGWSCGSPAMAISPRFNEFPPPKTTATTSNGQYYFTCGSYSGGIDSTNQIPASCASSLSTTDNQQLMSQNLRPSLCTPNERLTVFSNSFGPPTACSAAAQLTQAVALGCVLAQDGVLPIPTQAPSINGVEDIELLERWIGEMERFAANAVSRLYLENVPVRVVQDFKTGTVGTGSHKGAHGKLVLEYGTAVRSMHDGWFQLNGNLAKLRATIQGARANIKIGDVQTKIETKKLLIARWQVHSKIVNAIANSMSAFGFENAYNPAGGIAKGVAGATDLQLAIKESAALDAIEELQNELKDLTLLKTLTDLELTTSAIYPETFAALTALQKAAANAAQVSEELRFTEVSAQYQTAVGKGADFFLDEGGEPVELPVNIVLNRQYELTQRRYKDALQNARYLSYIARLAIEQRLGVRLDKMAEKVGPFEAPKEWAEDVCEMSGVNYEGLRDITVPDGGFADPDGGAPSTQNIDEFTDMFVGDYVDKLEKFVEYYNMEFPSHDGDDTAVLSLRDDLLGPTGVCTALSPNLLAYSSDLTASHFLDDGEGGLGTVGWVRRPCVSADSFCLQREIGATLQPAPSSPATETVGGATWLREVTASSITDVGELSNIAAAVSPARIVYQEVSLEAGQYSLSWWDQARMSTGQPGTSLPYPTTVFDSSWAVVKTQVNTPQATLTGAEWSGRRSLPFTVSKPGVFFVAFSAAEAGTGPGSVVIADVQLEKNTAVGLFVPTGASKVVISADCAVGSMTAFQTAFVHKCDSPSACYYELKAPFVIDTPALVAGNSKLWGKLAADNFNYRHITVALNVVGTGVVDCTLEPTASCFGSPFLDYTLDHSAFDAVVLSHTAPDHHYNFGKGFINHGKALAAERFITLPVSSADQALLSQPAFEKNEYRGRPLDGSYRLRIHDKPSLQWNKVEDIQVVLRYRYWSRIQPEATTQ